MEPHWAVLYRRAPVALRRPPAHRPLRRHTMHNPRPLWWAQAQARHYRPTNSPPRWTQAGSAASSRRWVAVNQPTGDRKCKAQMTCLNSSSIHIGKPLFEKWSICFGITRLGRAGCERWPGCIRMVGALFLGNFLLKGGGQNACQNNLCTFKLNSTMY